MEVIRQDTKFKFMARRHIFLMLSVVAMLTSAVLLATKGLNYGIDFRGGIELRYQFKNEVNMAVIRSILESKGWGSAIVQKTQGTQIHEYLVSFRLENEGSSQKPADITSALQTAFPNEQIELRKVDSVGPRVGADLKKAAVLSMVYTMLIILAYVWFRFNIIFSPPAVLALFHDVLITMGVLVVLRAEFDLSVVAALLTIVGYSLNDTIVVFDRVRDNLIHQGKLSLEHVLDRSINETLSRTILTSLTTFNVCVILILMGGPTLYPFALTMATGVVVGTYSSVYIASPIALWIDHWLSQRKERKLKPAHATQPR